MWVCLNNSFLSIVSKDCGPGELLVRARVKGHIEAVFPDAVVSEATHTDYRYRAVIKRADVAEAIGAKLYRLDYPNFKNSVKDDALHSAYAAFWNVHARLQPTAPYTGRPQRAS
jgi:hypothetical protein